MLKKGITRADTDGLYYRIEDTRWHSWPDDLDPGILGPKIGAQPIPDNEAYELDKNPKANINDLPYDHPDNDPREESITSSNHSQLYNKYGSDMADIGITIRLLEKSIRKAQDITNTEKADLLDIFSNILIAHGKNMRID